MPKQVTKRLKKPDTPVHLQQITLVERHDLIALRAYLQAEARGFQGGNRWRTGFRRKRKSIGKSD